MSQKDSFLSIFENIFLDVNLTSENTKWSKEHARPVTTAREKSESVFSCLVDYTIRY